MIGTRVARERERVYQYMCKFEKETHAPSHVRIARSITSRDIAKWPSSPPDRTRLRWRIKHAVPCSSSLTPFTGLLAAAANDGRLVEFFFFSLLSFFFSFFFSPSLLSTLPPVSFSKTSSPLILSVAFLSCRINQRGEEQGGSWWDRQD